MDAKNILFIPDCNLGHYVSEQIPEKNFKLLHGGCPIHASVTESKLLRLKKSIRALRCLFTPNAYLTLLNTPTMWVQPRALRNTQKTAIKKNLSSARKSAIAEHLQYACPDKNFYYL